MYGTYRSPRLKETCKPRASRLCCQISNLILCRTLTHAKFERKKLRMGIIGKCARWELLKGLEHGQFVDQREERLWHGSIAGVDGMT